MEAEPAHAVIGRCGRAVLIGLAAAWLGTAPLGAADRDPRYDYDPPEPGSYRLPPLKPAGDGTVLDEQGRAVRLHGLLEGKVTVLGFIYTRCADPDGCPLTWALLADLYYLSSEDPALADRLQLVALSFDPEYDTPDVMAFYGLSIRDTRVVAAPFQFLTTSGDKALRPILRAYDQPIGPKSDLADPYGPWTHQLRVFLIDPQLRIRNIYSLGFMDPRLVLADVRTLILESEPTQ
ncbi:MAG: SCO family protein [Alphaproteobacteria bacterium]|nr:SCO family protein [Alphaproteobacteria bacterium]